MRSVDSLYHLLFRARHFEGPRCFRQALADQFGDDGTFLTDSGHTLTNFIQFLEISSFIGHSDGSFYLHLFDDVLTILFENPLQIEQMILLHREHLVHTVTFLWRVE